MMRLDRPDRSMIWILGIAWLTSAQLLHAADIQLGVEVEFRSEYRPDKQATSSFQLRESKLILDTIVSPHLSALFEFAFEESRDHAGLDRGYFQWHPDKFNTQLKFGQFRIPFGNWDAYTIDRSLIKNTRMGASEAFSGFKLRQHDVGIQIRTTLKRFSMTNAIVNGSSIGVLEDDNDHKDYISELGIRLGSLNLQGNVYLGTQGGVDRSQETPVQIKRRIRAYGLNALYYHRGFNISGEVIFRMDIGERRAAGGYAQVLYDLMDIYYGLRFIGKVEYFDSNTRQPGGDVTQSILGLKQTLARGMTLQIEYQKFSRQDAAYRDGVQMEIELEL